MRFPPGLLPSSECSPDVTRSLAFPGPYLVSGMRTESISSGGQGGTLRQTNLHTNVRRRCAQGHRSGQCLHRVDNRVPGSLPCVQSSKPNNKSLWHAEAFSNCSFSCYQGRTQTLSASLNTDAGNPIPAPRLGFCPGPFFLLIIFFLQGV